MSNILWKNFHLCFFKLNCLPPPQPAEHQHSCHPPLPGDYAFPIPPTSVVTRNINSLPDTTSPENSTTSSNHSTSLTPHTTDDPSFTSSSEDSDFAAAAAATSTPDLASVYASQRFFFSSPGRSNSIIDSCDCLQPPSPTNLAESAPTVAGTGGFTVQKYSSDPYGDFRRSMQEMIEARDMKDLNNESWEYLHELLLCYLALNPKQTHRFIVGAFTDIVLLLTSQPTPQTTRPALADKPGELGGRRQWAANPRSLV